MAALTSRNIICKQSGESIAVSMDFSAWLSDANVISNPQSAVEPSGLTISNLSISGQTATMVLEDGTDGTIYRVQITIDVDDGQVLIGDGICKVRDR